MPTNFYEDSFFFQSKSNSSCFPLLEDDIENQPSEVFMPDLEFELSSVAVSNFKQFFKNSFVATPQSLNRTPSLRRLQGLTALRRLTTYLMRGGKFYKILKVLLNAFDYLETVSKTTWYGSINSFRWGSLYLSLASLVVHSNFTKPIHNLCELKYGDIIELVSGDVTKLGNININLLFKEIFKKFNFLFSFYIYKVDKQIYKNSRGRSGKYTFVWKYVAPYKRAFIIMHWLAREIRVSSGKTFKDRVLSIISNFFLATTNTWIWKIKKFSLNYVYFNLRKTLGETYLTSMR